MTIDLDIHMDIGANIRVELSVQRTVRPGMGELVELNKNIPKVAGPEMNRVIRFKGFSSNLFVVRLTNQRTIKDNLTCRVCFSLLSS